MRIAEVTAHVLETNLSRPFAWSFDSTAKRSACLVEIVGEDGTTGWGEGFGPAELPAELNTAVNGAFRPHLLGAEALDANHGYDAVEAVALGRALADCNIGWFEEPVVPDDLTRYREVRNRQPMPVAGGETWFTRWNFRDELCDRAVDIVQPDACAAGGADARVRSLGASVSPGGPDGADRGRNGHGRRAGGGGFGHLGRPGGARAHWQGAGQMMPPRAIISRSLGAALDGCAP